MADPRMLARALADLPEVPGYMSDPLLARPALPGALVGFDPTGIRSLADASRPSNNVTVSVDANQARATEAYRRHYWEERIADAHREFGPAYGKEMEKYVAETISNQSPRSPPTAEESAAYRAEQPAFVSEPGDFERRMSDIIQNKRYRP